MRWCLFLPHCADLIVVLVIICCICPPRMSSGLRIQGEFHTKDFFMFLAKFGFQKTDLRDSANTQGYIFGNVTLIQPDVAGPEGDSAAAATDRSLDHKKVTLAVLDRGYFLEYYGNRTLFDKQKACTKMFDKVSRIAYDPVCYDDGEEDFLRSAPCDRDQLCPEEDNPKHVVKGAQFTYRIQDFGQSRFWYVSLVSCYRNQVTCKYEPMKEDYKILVDVHLVNGNPEGSNKNVFRYQYSYDSQDLFGVYLVVLLVYLLLVPIQTYANTCQSHPITRLLLGDLTCELLALLATNLHQAIFSANGFGWPWLGTLGDILEIFSQSLFMLLLLLLSMGWAVTRRELKYKTLIFTMWLAYVLLHSLLYIWKKFEVDVIEDIEEYQTVPGLIILCLRIVVMLSFLFCLRDTMLHEFNADKLNFFLHFGAASLVWFIYLPLMAVVAWQISALWRTKFIIGVTYTADTFAYSVLMHLLWPRRKEQYVLLAAPDSSIDELEELYESPNNLLMSRREENPGLVPADPPASNGVQQRSSKKLLNGHNNNLKQQEQEQQQQRIPEQPAAAAVTAAATASYQIVLEETEDGDEEPLVHIE